jgi:transposase
MKDPRIIGVDLAKSSFQIHVCNERGRKLDGRKVNRGGFKSYLRNLPDKSQLFMEACGSAHYWGRKAQDLGHSVKLIAPQYVAPFVKRDKTDANDAQAICDAASRDHMNFVPVKTVYHQDYQSVIRIRERLIETRTRLCNQVRGLLSEYGVVCAQGHSSLKAIFIRLADDSDFKNRREFWQDLTPFLREEILLIKTEYEQINERLAGLDKKLATITKQDENCKRLQTIPGIGPITAISLVAAVGNGAGFGSGRQLSAWLGLVPKQHSTGGKAKILGLSKRGNKYLRSLFIHGARAVMINAGTKNDPRSKWVVELQKKVGMNKAAVAMANRNARTAWAILNRGESYNPVKDAEVLQDKKKVA